MRSESSTAGIVPGEGLVARFGGVVVFIAEETASTDRILGAVEAVADTEHPGAAIAQRLAAVVFGAGSQPPSFGVVAPTDDGTLILLRGPVAATVSGAEGTRKLTGSRAFTWVDEIVREPVRTITVGPDTAAQPEARTRTDLRAGVVPGGGFVLTARVRRSRKKPSGASPRPANSSGTTAQPPATAPAGLAAADPDPAEHTRTRAVAEPSPVAEPSAVPEPVAAQPISLAWSQAPAALRPTAAPEPIALRKAGPHDSLRRRPRPALGAGKTSHLPGTSALGTGRDTTASPALIAEDGAAYPLDRPYVIGRGPSADESVRRATAAPIVLQRDRHISRVHAYVSVDGGKVYIRDAGTTSGTFVSTPGSPRWTRIGRSPTELPPGARVRISEQVLTYQRDHPSQPG
ncbi:FHA domain-containing protein [Nocardia donostiensis]|uniref:FHA domain-containing protein n=1 Tax=Nocardia donostiensis TaxID=1538463 RepID=UPI0009D916E7|nr:FHA domain-containing protein [Nocardia donostiensis]